MPKSDPLLFCGSRSKDRLAERQSGGRARLQVVVVEAAAQEVHQDRIKISNQRFERSPAREAACGCKRNRHRVLAVGGVTPGLPLAAQAVKLRRLCEARHAPAPETWPSGRRHSPAKGACGQKLHRGFESLRLRQTFVRARSPRHLVAPSCPLSRNETTRLVGTRPTSRMRTVPSCLRRGRAGPLM